MVIYETIRLVSLALLTITIPVFVLATTFSKDALHALDDKKGKLKEEEEALDDNAIKQIKKQLKKAKTKDVSKLQDTLDDLERSKNKINVKKKKFENKVNRLDVVHNLIQPGGAFFVAIFFSSIASMFDPLSLVSILYGIGSISGLTIGIYKLVQSISAIQEISLISYPAEDTGIDKEKSMAQAMKIALEEINEKDLGLTFKSLKPPFQFTPNSENTIDFYVGINKGGIAKDMEAWFIFPDNFKLEGGFGSTWNQAKDYTIPHGVTGRVSLDDINKGVNNNRSFSIIVPDKPGIYSCIYILKGDGYYSGKKNFDVEVVDS